MGRKESIIQDMERHGTYDKAFLPTINALVTRERELSAIRKAWKATAAPGERPSFEHPLYAEIKAANKDILTLQDYLGLTPKGLTRLRRQTAPQTETAPPPSSGNAAFSQLLDTFLESANGSNP